MVPFGSLKSHFSLPISASIIRLLCRSTSRQRSSKCLGRFALRQCSAPTSENPPGPWLASFATSFGGQSRTSSGKPRANRAFFDVIDAGEAMFLAEKVKSLDQGKEHGSLNVPIEHHPTIRYMVYNGYFFR